MNMRLPGGIGLTLLHVYNQEPGPDGVKSGCAHIHGLTDEAYFGVSGRGSVELHHPDTGYQNIEILPGTYVQFPPGTLHRSVNDQDLVVLAIMSNSGLAERGDARIYFGAEVDQNPSEYDQLRSLAQDGLEGALQRRDHATKAYQQLMNLYASDRPAYRQELIRFRTLHAKSLANYKQEYSQLVDTGPGASLQQVKSMLDALPEATFVDGQQIGKRNLTSEKSIYGMCGLIQQLSQLESK